MRFCINARRVRVAARSLKYVRMYSIRRRAAVNGLLSKNLRPQRKRNFPVLQGGRTQKYRAYFKDDNAVKPNNFPPRRRIVLWLYPQFTRNYTPQNGIISSFSALSSISVLPVRFLRLPWKWRNSLRLRSSESEGIKSASGKARLNEKCTGRTWNQSSAAGRRFYAFWPSFLQTEGMDDTSKV